MENNKWTVRRNCCFSRRFFTFFLQVYIRTFSPSFPTNGKMSRPEKLLFYRTPNKLSWPWVARKIHSVTVRKISNPNRFGILEPEFVYTYFISIVKIKWKIINEPSEETVVLADAFLLFFYKRTCILFHRLFAER